MEESLFVKYLRIASVVFLYWFVSISMVFVNKHLLSNKELDAPFFVTWFQCVVTVALCAFMRLLAKMSNGRITFTEFHIDLQVLKQVLPLSVVFVAMITLNNLCLKYVAVTFYYIGRSLTTVFNVVLVYFILNQKTSCKAIICCAVIIAGFLMGVDQEGIAGSLSLLGVLFGVGASMAVALNSIYTKKILPVVDQNIWKLTLYNNVNATLLVIPLMIVFGDVKAVYNFPNLLSTTFWFFMSVAGVFGFAMGYVTGLQIQVTSPLTHNISGTAKACAQTVMATMYFSEVKTFLWWTSNFVVLFGSAAYTYVKQQEMKQEHNMSLEMGAKSANAQSKPGK